MTNIRGESLKREGVITDEEFIRLIRDLDPRDFNHPYYYYRIKGFTSIARRTGKRREELSLLKFSDVEVEPDSVRFVFTLKKKRKAGMYYTRSPPKKVMRGDPVSEWIVGYLEYLKDLCPECVWVFPRTMYSELTGTFKIYPAKRLKGRQLLNVVKQLDPSLWCHLFRDSMGADIVKKHEGHIVSVFEVKEILDLSDIKVAFRYLRRYGEQIIRKPPE